MSDQNFRAHLDHALRLLLDDDSIPDTVPLSWIAERFHVSKSAVHHAVDAGRLPAELIHEHAGKVYVARPSDAMLIWGHRVARGGDA